MLRQSSKGIIFILMLLGAGTVLVHIVFEYKLWPDFIMMPSTNAIVPIFSSYVQQIPHVNRTVNVSNATYVSAVATSVNQTCNATFEPTFEENLHYIQSYNLSSALPYMDILQLKPRPLSTIDQSDILPPIFVTGCSSNHFKENMALLENIERIVRPVIKDLKIVVYDLGLKHATERNQLSAACKCVVRKFPFEVLPKHFATIKGCIWKPIVMQLVLKEYPFVMWMDSSVRFTTGNLKPMFEKAISSGIIQVKRQRPERELYIQEQTHEQTFQVLNEAPCLYENLVMVEAGLILVYAKDYIVEGIMNPWTKCALVMECMFTTRPMKQILKCHIDDNVIVNHSCHRYDQSVLNILMKRLFHDEMKKHLTVECEYSYFRNERRCEKYNGETFDEAVTHNSSSEPRLT